MGLVMPKALSLCKRPFVILTYSEDSCVCAYNQYVPGAHKVDVQRCFSGCAQSPQTNSLVGKSISYKAES